MAVKAYDACVMGANGNLYESDGNTLNFTAGPVKNMLQVWQDLVKDGYTTTDVFADADANRTNFKAGRVAMHIAPASRWIEVMQRCLDDEDREWIRHHRNQCLKKAQRPPAPKEEFADLHQAAKETQYRMGIAKPYGEAFRLPGKGKTAAE